MSTDIYHTQKLTQNQSKWKVHYEKLILRGQTRASSKKEANELLEYTEKHHIIPVCMGGDNIKDNFVYLTPEEHYVAHQLLAKIFPDNNGLKSACHLMCVDSNGRRVHNREYGWIKRAYAKTVSLQKKGKTKETDDSVRKTADALRGRTKDTHDYLMRLSLIKTGVPCPAVSEALTGRTKKSHQYIEDGAAKQRGRTKFNHSGIALGAEKRSATMSGRKAEDFEHIRDRAEKVNILSKELRIELVHRRRNGEAMKDIHHWLLSLDIKIAYPTLGGIFRRENKLLD